MDMDKKLAFVHKLAKLGLEHVKHYDGGGVISGGSTSNPLSAASGALTTQNTYNAAAPVQAGTIGAQETALSGQLSNEAAGSGPNPAQLQYTQNAQGMAQSQAALNAQNRALNPGLAARQSGNAAVQAEQTAAGGAAAQQGQQQLAAQQQEAGLANVEQNGLTSANGINAQVSQNNANAVNNTEGGILGGIGGAIGSLFSFSEGGEVKKMSGGGSVSVAGVPNFSNANSMPSGSSGLGNAASNIDLSSAFGSGPTAPASSSVPTSNDWYQFATANPGSVPTSDQWASMMAPGMAKGGKVKADVPAMVSPGEEYLTPKKAKAVADGKASAMKVGEKIKGKASIKGDSLKNDTVPKMLKDGGMIIPRSITQMHPDRAAAFVRAHLSKHGMGMK